jgi:Helix-turn-helix domain
MRCYSHLSDDEREQIGLGKALGHSIGAIAQAIGLQNRRSRANSPATGCRAGATRRFTPPEPINCAGGVKR